MSRQVYTSEEFQRLNRLAGGNIQRSDLDLLEKQETKTAGPRPPKPKGATEDPEDTFQAEAVKWIRSEWPGLLVFHVPNGGKRSKREAAKFIGMGVVPGIPDIHIPSWRAVIELKKKGGRLSDEQVEILEYYQETGWRTAVCWNMEQVQHLMRLWFDEMVRTVDPRHSRINWRHKWS